MRCRRVQRPAIGVVAKGSPEQGSARTSWIIQFVGGQNCFYIHCNNLELIAFMLTHLALDRRYQQVQMRCAPEPGQNMDNVVQ